MNVDQKKRRVQFTFCSSEINITLVERERVQKEIRHNGPVRKFVYNIHIQIYSLTFLYR